MECTFYIGQKVICIDPAGLEDTDFALVEGQVYTIRDVGPIPDWQLFYRAGPYGDGEVGVRLEGIIRWTGVEAIAAETPDEAMYSHLRFKPLIETDISVFHAILKETLVSMREPERV